MTTLVDIKNYFKTKLESLGYPLYDGKIEDAVEPCFFKILNGRMLPVEKDAIEKGIYSYALTLIYVNKNDYTIEEQSEIYDIIVENFSRISINNKDIGEFVLSESTIYADYTTDTFVFNIILEK